MILWLLATPVGRWLGAAVAVVAAVLTALGLARRAGRKAAMEDVRESGAKREAEAREAKDAVKVDETLKRWGVEHD